MSQHLMMESQKYDAPDGKIWICVACGLQSKNRENGPRGWFDGCFLNAELRDEIKPIYVTSTSKEDCGI